MHIIVLKYLIECLYSSTNIQSNSNQIAALLTEEEAVATALHDRLIYQINSNFNAQGRTTMVAEHADLQTPSDKTTAAASNSAASENLSNSVFQNPREFLQTLKDNFGKIKGDSHSDDDELSKADLLSFSETSSDPKAKAAAGIAYQNYDKMLSIDNTLDGTRPSSSDQLTMSSIEDDEKLASGSLRGLKLEGQFSKGALALTLGATSVAAGALAVDAIEIPPFSYIGGALALSTGSMALLEAKRALGVSSQVDAAAVEVKNMSTWKGLS